MIARLLVSPSARRQHVERQLLDHATGAARQAGLVAVLDVVSTSSAAINLYESAEWFRLGAVAFQLTDGRTVEEIVFVADDPNRTRAPIGSSKREGIEAIINDALTAGLPY